MSQRTVQKNVNGLGWKSPRRLTAALVLGATYIAYPTFTMHLKSRPLTAIVQALYRQNST